MTDNSLNVITELLESYGITNYQKKHGGKHPYVEFEVNGSVYKQVYSGTPSDHRSIKNLRSQIERTLTSLGLEKKQMDEKKKQIEKTVPVRVVVARVPKSVKKNGPLRLSIFINNGDIDLSKKYQLLRCEDSLFITPRPTGYKPVTNPKSKKCRIAAVIDKVPFPIRDDGTDRKVELTLDARKNKNGTFVLHGFENYLKTFDLLETEDTPSTKNVVETVPQEQTPVQVKNPYQDLKDALELLNDALKECEAEAWIDDDGRVRARVSF